MVLPQYDATKTAIWSTLKMLQPPRVRYPPRHALSLPQPTNSKCRPLRTTESISNAAEPKGELHYVQWGGEFTSRSLAHDHPHLEHNCGWSGSAMFPVERLVYQARCHSLNP